MNLYITFGQNHFHKINGRVFDKNTVGVLSGRDEAEVFDKLNRYFGLQYAFTYVGKPPAQWERYYDMGIVEVEPRWAGRELTR